MKKNKNILILTGWSYKEALVQVYTLPYVRMIREIIPSGHTVIFVTFEQQGMKLSDEESGQVKKQLSQEGITWLPFRYQPFGIMGLLFWGFHLLRLFRIVLTRQIRCIHAWCMPAGALGYFLSVLTGKPLVIDSYEPHAEAMVENGTWKKNSFRFSLLFRLEKKISHHARAVISATHGMKAYAFEKYHAELSHFFVKPACVDLEHFSTLKKKNPVLLKELHLEDKIVCVYAGKFGGIYLTTEVFDFLKIARDYWGPGFKVLLLSNHPAEELKHWARQSQLDWKDVILRFVPPSEIPDYIGLADFALTPVKPVPTKRYCTPIKDGEYWAMGLPVVITKDISDDSGIIEKHDAGVVLQSLDPGAYLAAVKKIDALLRDKNYAERKNTIRSLAVKHRNFSNARKIYLETYTTLIP